MRTDLPLNMRQSFYSLTPEAIVRLFVIELRNGALFRLSPYERITWRGDVYEPVPCDLTEVTQDANGKITRPKFVLVNPGGVFTPAVYEGQLDNAWISRFRVMKSDIDANINAFSRERFRVSRVLSITDPLITLELRDILDGHPFQIPADSYLPPDFPHVRLS